MFLPMCFQLLHTYGILYLYVSLQMQEHARQIDNQVVEYTEVIVRPEFSKYYTDGIFKNGIYQVNAQFVI